MIDAPRVEIVVGDVGEVLAASRGRFDCIMLDVDNGASGLTSERAGVYSRSGGSRGGRGRRVVRLPGVK